MANILIAILFIVAGLIGGSFLNCLIYRLKKKENFLIGRSYCLSCQHLLGFFDLIPLLSFIFLRGKCRYCQKPISFQYPLVELSTALIFLLLYFYFFEKLNLFQFFLLLVLSALLIAIFVFDLKYYLIPDEIIYPSILIAFFYQLFGISNFKELLNPFLSAILASAFFFSIVLISKGKWMGAGDPKLAFLMGVLLGFPDILIALFFAFFVGATIGIFLIILGRKKMKSEIPFAPFLVSGTFFALFFWEKLFTCCFYF